MYNQLDRTKDEREARKEEEREARCVAWSAVDGEKGSRRGRGSGGILWLCADYVGRMGEGELEWMVQGVSDCSHDPIPYKRRSHQEYRHSEFDNTHCIPRDHPPYIKFRCTPFSCFTQLLYNNIHTVI